MKRGAACALAALAGALLSSCTAVNPYYDAARSHHRPAGFQNNYNEFTTKGLTDFLR